MNVIPPEEIELAKKRRKLERLKETLVFREEEMTELRAELEQFEANYTIEVGRFYARLDEIEAEIAEEEVKLNPDDEEIKKKAEDARKRAEESAIDEDEVFQACSNKYNPTPEQRKTYHKLARLIHPDLALESEERQRRTALMAELNDAFSDGDERRLKHLVEEYRDSPELVKGDSVGDEWVRAIRRISQISNRLKSLKTEKTEIELSELFILREKVRAEQIEGRNLFRQMAERTKSHIKKAERRLNNLKNVNDAVEKDINERYGLNVSAFR